ncbi:MAG: calcium/sodium antiporter [Lachnospiraceae bacterium]|nr:calcium/sodium antiporter [Lachnospiraceae bacterium]
MIFIFLLTLIIGFAVLLKGADVFVDGSCGMARIFNVPGLVIGLTLVSMGTSAPELAISTVAAIQGSNEIALSNVIGSNIFNLLIVLGICSIIKPLPVAAVALKRDYPILLISTVMVFVIAVVFQGAYGSIGDIFVSEEVGIVSRKLGMLLLGVFVIYLIILFVTARGEEEDVPQKDDYTIKKCIIMIVAGLIMIITGGQAVVYGARNIAAAMGLSETLIGLTVVAFGTSLPELMTSIVAAGKGETGLAVGNVLGSNIFNMLFILGISSSVHPIIVNGESAVDLVILIVISVIAYIFSFSKKKIGRFEGICMVFIYVADLIYVIRR